MGRYNFKPARVYQTATIALEARSTAQSSSSNKSSYPPPWYKTIGSIPPGEILTRTPPIPHRDVIPRRRIRKPSKMFAPQNITYEEDKLRQIFYGHHPWELARPRIILEQDGKDGQKCDWSKTQQAGRQLNAESVIQRQLWLLHNVEGMTSAKAYDIARGEFYTLRHQEDVERRVAKEEALSTGAYFGKSVLEFGMELEDEVYEYWKTWAMKEIQTNEQRRNAVYTSAGVADTKDLTSASTTDTEDWTSNIELDVDLAEAETLGELGT